METKICLSLETLLYSVSRLFLILSERLTAGRNYLPPPPASALRIPSILLPLSRRNWEEGSSEPGRNIIGRFGVLAIDPSPIFNIASDMNENSLTKNSSSQIAGGEQTSVGFWFPGRWVGGTAMTLGPILIFVGTLLRIQFHFFFPQQLAAFEARPTL